jgi:hypothetical protein
MQFHLNGFRPGDPEISESAEHYDGPRSSGFPLLFGRAVKFNCVETEEKVVLSFGRCHTQSQ